MRADDDPSTNVAPVTVHRSPTTAHRSTFATDDQIESSFVIGRNIAAPGAGFGAGASLGDGESGIGRGAGVGAGVAAGSLPGAA